MSAQVFSGRLLAQSIIENELIPQAQKLIKKNIQPTLIVFWVGDNPSSASYIRQKQKYANQIGITLQVEHFESSISEKELIESIQKANQDPRTHGIIVQQPLPSHIATKNILDAIAPQKDVDGFTPTNIGKLFLGEPGVQTCTPKGIMTMLKFMNVQIQGKHAVVVGRSNIVGKPIAALLLQQGATVTQCHSQTKNLSDFIQQAEILVVAIGRPEYIQGEWIKEGTIVIDVGINKKSDGTLCGDVHFESVKEKASIVTPVPGGVGPMTVVSLLQNTLDAAENTKKLTY